MNTEVMEGEETPPPYLYDLPRLLVPDNGHWRDHGACTGRHETTRLFFGELPDGRVPRGGGKVKQRITEEAKKICAECTVRKECFRFAKNNNIGHGVWGGVDFSPTRKGSTTKYRIIPDDID